jgi:CheY-like chemotaxis protein
MTTKLITVVCAGIPQVRGGMMPARILVVDDDPDTLKLLRLILESSGYDPVLTENGHQALSIIAERRPDLVLCDVLMPVLDGYETLVAIRTNPQTEILPVLMLSALGQEHDVQRALEAGADGYIVKPFTLRPLLTAIQEKLAAAALPVAAIPQDVPAKER